MASLNTNTNINIPSSTNSIQLNPHDYVNKGINDIIVDYLHFLTPSKQRSMSTLFIGVGILIGADVVKSIVQSLIRENTKNINDTILSTIKLFSFDNLYQCGEIMWNYAIFKKYRLVSFFQRRRRTHIDEYVQINKQQENFYYGYIISVSSDNIFVNNLINILENYNQQKVNIYPEISSISFTEKQSENINIINSELKYEKVLTDITINYENLNIIIDSLTYVMNETRDFVIKQNSSGKSKLFDILTKKHSGYEKYYSHATQFFNAEFITQGDSIILNVTKLPEIPCYSQQFKKTFNLTQNIFQNTIITIIDDLYDFEKEPEYKSLKDVLVYNMTVFGFILSKNRCGCTWSPYCDRLCGFINGQFVRGKSCTQIMCDYACLAANDPKMIYICADYANDPLQPKIISNDHNNANVTSPSTDNPPQTNNNFKKIELKMRIRSDSTNNKKELYEKFNCFVKYVNIMSKRHNVDKKINIYTISINEKVVSNSKQNDEYVKYMEMKTKLVEEKKSMEDIIKLIGVEPKKEIVTDVIEKEVKKILVNTKYCAFNNLYLRQEQDKKLYELVNMFQNDKPLMKELGIPNKLGILLHGEPGCGKTTTIVTVASYFGRDIFYINLKLIKKNEDLKFVFDHINGKHSGGGIIVLEDIDAMTNIVKKRGVSEEMNTTELLETNVTDITLEYMLNLLDGTLTFDDSIVIMTTNHLECLDPALYRPGRIDKLIEMKKCDYYQIARIFKKFIQRDIRDDVLMKIPQDAFTPAQIIFHLINWIKCKDESDDVIMKDFTA